MQSPYTASPLDAVMAAQSSLGAALTAVAWFKPLRPRASTAVVVLAIWACVLMPALPEFLRGLGVETAATFPKTLLYDVELAVAAAALLATPRWIGAFALACVVPMRMITGYIEQCDGELAALHLIWIGLLLGLYRAATAPRDAGGRAHCGRPFLAHDLALGLFAMACAAFVSWAVLDRALDSADEWAYTYQAAVLAKLRAYGHVPPCGDAFRSFWVFYASGRQFSQYTPGWPLVMVPFVWARALWLAGPFSLGLLAAGVARLARRAASDPRDAGAAGVLAALSVTLGSTMLINGGSRFPHLFEAACWAWAVEAACIVSTRGLGARAQTRWGALLGAAVAMGLATRPPDGALLATGTGLYLSYALARRRIGARAVLAGLVALASLGGLTLVILRLQLGKWFTTGYSLTSDFYPWNVIAFSVPHASEFRWALPLATGSYCWWPCAPALGVAGLVCARPRERRVLFMLAVSSAATLAFYVLSEIGRNVDFGYGPRYQLVHVVPMAVGGGVLFARMWTVARARFSWRRALAAGGPMALALAAAVVGIVRIAPLVYPYNHDDVEKRTAVFRAAKKQGLHDAVVFIEKGTTLADPLDQTQNMPLDLYENDVLYAMDTGPQSVQCVRERFPHRRVYRTTGFRGGDPTLAPY